MRVFKETNVNRIFPQVVNVVQQEGERADSRNGPTLEFPQPVTSVYQLPWERVLFCPKRDANPFFHFFESLWMLAGRNDLKFPTEFAKNIASFSDDGETLNGSAYGKRWRDWFVLTNKGQKHPYFGTQFDQLEGLIEMLALNPLDRRAVIQMWDPEADFRSPSKDVPCNMSVVFRVRKGQLGDPVLTMTVYNRSNDIVWGAYGANAVHFSVLQEYVAGRLGLLMGEYYQVSNSLHAYTENPAFIKVKDVPFTTETDYYATGEVVTYAMFDPLERPELWDRDLMTFFKDPFSNAYTHSFFRKIVKPMYAAHKAYKKKDLDAAWEALAQMPTGNDWRKACEEWFTRRSKAGAA